MQGWCFDIEADGLYLQSKKIWYMKFKALDGSRELSIYPFQESKEVTTKKVQNWIDSFDESSYVVGWNILGYDLWML